MSRSSIECSTPNIVSDDQDMLHAHLKTTSRIAIPSLSRTSVTAQATNLSARSLFVLSFIEPCCVFGTFVSTILCLGPLDFNLIGFSRGTRLFSTQTPSPMPFRIPPSWNATGHSSSTACAICSKSLFALKAPTSAPFSCQPAPS
jgi:hypothetical protein